MNKRQLQIGLFTIIISLGLFKLSEISEIFNLIVKLINNLSIEESITKPSVPLLSILFLCLPILFYFIYILSIGLGLFQFFKNRNNIETAMIFAVGSFFVFYIMILLQQLHLIYVTLPTY